MRKIVNAGDRFGSLTVVAEKPSAGNFRLFYCRCDCGNFTTVRSTNLYNGHTRSCGCIRRESTRQRKTKHGYARSGRNRTGTYHAWSSMHKRCKKGDPNYAGKGITVCEKWNSFEAFLADMGEKPEGYSIERIDVFGHYCPENCKWIPMAEQARNKSTNIWLEFEGVRRLAIDWAKDLGINPSVLRDRVKRGWSDEKALTTPVRESRKHAC